MIRKWAKDMKRYFTRGHTGDNKYVKRCPISVAVREKQMKTWVRQHYIPGGRVNIKCRATLLAG